jgi:hypothetical protein
VPVIGRIAEQALLFDLRCLESEQLFVDNLAGLPYVTSTSGACADDAAPDDVSA